VFVKPLIGIPPITQARSGFFGAKRAAISAIEVQIARITAMLRGFGYPSGIVAR
jgi:hypothetical protein